MEATKGFRRLKAYKHLPVLRAALAAHQSKYVTQRVEHDAAQLLRLLQQNLGHPPMRGRLRVGKEKLHVAGFGRCSHVFDLLVPLHDRWP